MVAVVIKIIMIVMVPGAMRIKDWIHSIIKRIRERVDYNR